MLAMTGDEYLRSILSRLRVDPAASWLVDKVKNELGPHLEAWGGEQLLSVEPSGSFAKGTAVHAGTDIDFFLSMSSTTDETLENIHGTLMKKLSGVGYNPRGQNVSIGIKVDVWDVDLVPGRRVDQFSDDHNLYRRKTGTWTKTNVKKHISNVKSSGRTAEICLLKIWRRQQGLEFPSFYLEMAAIEALKYKSLDALADNTMAALTYLSKDFLRARFVDPANTNNVISDELSGAGRAAIATAASRATMARTWGEIIT